MTKQEIIKKTYNKLNDLYGNIILEDYISENDLFKLSKKIIAKKLDEYDNDYNEDAVIEEKNDPASYSYIQKFVKQQTKLLKLLKKALK